MGIAIHHAGEVAAPGARIEERRHERQAQRYKGEPWRYNADLPQKALIWQDDKGKVWISDNDPRYLQSRHDISGCDEVIAKISGALSGITTAASGK